MPLKLWQIGETFNDPIHLTNGMHYKNILTILSDDCTINVLLALALASVIIMLVSDATVWSVTLESSFTIVMCL